MENPNNEKSLPNQYAQTEIEFIEKICPIVGLNAERNPQKRNDPYAPNLIVNGQLSELKHITTPFFKAKTIHGLDPQFTVTVSSKDYWRFYEKYPNVIIYFWVDWQELVKVMNNEKFVVKPMRGLWRVSYKDLQTEAVQRIVEKRNKSLRYFRQSAGDNAGNIRQSDAFDLNNFECLWQEGL